MIALLHQKFVFYKKISHMRQCPLTRDSVNLPHLKRSIAGISINVLSSGFEICARCRKDLY